jgi:hypothetical protein
MFRSNDQRTLLWQGLFQPNKEQQNSLQQQHQQPSVMMSLSDNWQAQQLQQLHQFRLQQQSLPSAPPHRFQGDATGRRTQPAIPGLTSTLLEVQQYQALQGMIAEKEHHLLKLHQLKQLHDSQKYQDLVAQERGSGSTRAANFVAAASPVTRAIEPSNRTSTPEIVDDSAAAGIAANTTTTTTTTRNTSTPTPMTATASITEASVPTLAEEEEETANEEDQTADEEEETSSPQKRKSKKKDTKWLVTLEELKKYKQVHGDCIVPRGYALNPRLASWVAEQR